MGWHVALPRRTSIARSSETSCTALAAVPPSCSISNSLTPHERWTLASRALRATIGSTWQSKSGIGCRQRSRTACAQPPSSVTTALVNLSPITGSSSYSATGGTRLREAARAYTRARRAVTGAQPELSPGRCWIDTSRCVAADAVPCCVAIQLTFVSPMAIAALRYFLTRPTLR